MQRIQTRKLLIVAALPLVLAGCFGDSPKAPEAAKPAKPKSVAEYLHDIDGARARVHRAQIDGAASMKDEDALNASSAVAKAMSPGIMNCWPVKPSSTANTNHDCLDKMGYVR